MKELFAVAFLGLATLGLAHRQADAGWLFHRQCSCDTLIHCRQYNAFSPPCCSGDLCLNGGPAYGAACGSGAGHAAAGWGGHAAQMGQLPGTNAWTGPAVAGPGTLLPGLSTLPSSPPHLLGNGSALMPEASAPLPPGMMRPNGPMLYHPAVNPRSMPSTGVPAPQVH